MYVWRKLASGKWRDAWEERFHGLGQTNAVIRELKGGKSIRIEVYCKNLAQAEQIKGEFGGEVRRLKTKNWTRPPASKAPPIVIRDRIVVLPSEDEGRLERLRKKYPRREVISIPPEMAFGTGDHATTASCLRFLVDAARELKKSGEPWDQLDLGTGSGILAIAGKKLGARRVLGWDYDARAVRVARRNIKRNGAKGVRVEECNVLEWVPGPKEQGAYALVSANLFSDVLTAIFPKIAAVAAPGGAVIVSGILAEQAEECLAAGEAAGIVFERVVTRGKWISARGRKLSTTKSR